MNWQSFSRNPIQHYAPAWAVLLLGVVITIAVSTRLRQQSREAEQARFERAVHQTVGAIQGRLHQYQMAASATADFFSARETISQPEWRFRIQMLGNDQNYPGLLEAGYAELDLTATNEPAATVTTTIAPASSFRIRHAWARPPSAMSGVDPEFLAAPAQAAAAWESIRSSSATMSDQRELSAEVNGEPAMGFSIFAPVFSVTTSASASDKSASGENEVTNHRGRPHGVSFCAVAPGLLLESLFGETPREIGFELFSQPNPNATHWLNPSAKTPRLLNQDFRAYFQTNFPIQILNQTWFIHCYTTPLFEQESSLSRPWLVLPLGLSLTLALTGLLAIQIHARIRQHAVAVELRSACDELQQVQSERERMSRDLHDGAIQSLFLLQLMMGRCKRLLPTDAAGSRELLGQIRSGTDGLIAELRRFLLQDDVMTAEPVKFEQAHTTLRQLVQRLMRTESIEIKMTGHTSAPALLTSAQLNHLKQVAQEAMSNSLRHAQAKTLSLDLTASASVIRLSIVDNGQGFNPQEHSGSGNGLANMQARATHLGGTLKVDTSPGRGTAITLTFPATPISETLHEKTKIHPTADC